MPIGDKPLVDGLASEVMGGEAGKMQVPDDRVTEGMSGIIGDISIVDGLAFEVMREAGKRLARDEQRAEGMAGKIGDMRAIDDNNAG
ncbi:hypothetical protein CF121_08210 [Aeromonas media]|uniref:hypothetical protein n=1 Tax=Aeromonas media TaxID=651 RepID=UPI001115B5D0|nr:hypothetical protein [Aeromonas media]TNI62226.1 hypothetical protein CF121_08210 [Aeromonas media]